MTMPSPEQIKTENNIFELVFNESELVYHIDGVQQKGYLLTEEVAKEFYQVAALETGILPPVVRYLSADYRSCIIERPPAIHSMNVRLNVAGKTKPEPKLMALPWTVYVIRLNSSNLLEEMQIFFRNQQIWNTDDDLYRACLPNVYSGGKVCTYGGRNAGSNKEHIASTLADGINTAIANYWGGIGNLDLPYFFEERNSCPSLVAKKMKENLLGVGRYKSDSALADAFFKVYETITLNDALEMEYIKQTTVSQVIKTLQYPSYREQKVGPVTNLRAYFTPILNRAKNRQK